MKNRIWPFALETFILMSITFLMTTCIYNAPPFDEAKWRNDTSHQDPAALYAPHFKDGKFFNPWMPMDRSGLGRVLKWKMTVKSDYSEEEKSFAPRLVPDLQKRIEALDGKDFIVWIGHSTFLIRINGEYWLTDPIFSKRALIPKRKNPPALSLEEMKGLVGRLNIIISHNHYDHYDEPSIAGLPKEAKVYVPLGLKKPVEGLNRGHVTEMDWWQEVDLGNGSRLVCLPVQHWSRRISQSIDTTLWASFLLITPKSTIYYGADSGYFVGYQEIGRVYPGIDYALLPIGAYHPRWFMHYAHMNMDEALRAFDDLGARRFIPTQWGTFQLGDEPIGYPILDLQRTIKEKGFDASKLIVLNLGDILPIESRGGKNALNGD